jgi:hypothetical protein
VAQNALGQPADSFSTFLARVEQDEIVDDHTILVITQTVDELGRVRAPPADHSNLDPHARQRTIR